MQNWIFFALLVINILAFLYVGIDKKQSAAGEARAPEGALFFLATLFASLGILLGMFFYRHKTRKLYFVAGIIFLLLQQIILTYVLLGNSLK